VLPLHAGLEIARLHLEGANPVVSAFDLAVCAYTQYVYHRGARIMLVLLISNELTHGSTSHMDLQYLRAHVDMVARWTLGHGPPDAEYVTGIE
jgi:hypothetical protein